MSDTVVQKAPRQHVAPPGHSRASHRVHGWCSRCPGLEIWEELLAWRARENSLIDDASGIPDRVTPQSKEAERG